MRTARFVVGVVVAAAVVPASADSPDPRALLSAMARNVGRIEVACAPEAPGAAGAEAILCLGPYWSWKEFRKVWDEAIADGRRVPEVPVALSGWLSRPEVYERSYRLGSSTLRVAFDKKRESVTITSVTAPGPKVAAAAAVVPAADATPTAPVAPPSSPADSPEAESAVTLPPVDVEPAVIPDSRVAPVYPQQARALRLRARVELTVIVGPDGTSEGVVVDDCSTPGKGFEGAAVDAVTRWRFAPGRRGGEAVRATTRVVLTFNP